VVIVASVAFWSSAASGQRLSLPSRRASAALVDPFADFVTDASHRFGIPERWIRAVMRVESDGELRARSRKGAMGLMQIMPETWRDLRARYGLGADPYDPHDNILAGAAYLRDIHDRYGTPGFLAAYNVGPGRYEGHLATGRALPDETRESVAKLAPMIEGRQVERKIAIVSDASTWQRALLFMVRGESHSIHEPGSQNMGSCHLTNVRTVVDLSALVPQCGNLFVRRASQVRSQ